MAIALVVAESVKPVLKISVQDNSGSLHLKLEGKLAHPWTAELEAVWGQLVHSLEHRTLHLDLRGTTFVDPHGMHLLRTIVQAANPEILADSPLTRQYAEQARQAAEA